MRISADDEMIHVDNDSDEDAEMRSEPGLPDPIPCYPPQLLHHGYPGPHGLPPPPPTLGGSWPFQQFLHHQLALRALESECCRYLRLFSSYLQ